MVRIVVRCMALCALLVTLPSAVNDPVSTAPDAVAMLSRLGSTSAAR
ncbi:MAG: hypothetical protein ABL986_18520 [Vicinamibacterales bacterium]